MKNKKINVLPIEMVKNNIVSLLKINNLKQRGWRQGEDRNTTTALGTCRYRTKTIHLAKVTYEQDYAIVHKIILHEIAHALAGPNVGHKGIFKKIAYCLGTYQGCKVTDTLQPIKQRYHVTCTCGACDFYRSRLTRVIQQSHCSVCKGDLTIIDTKIREA